MTWFYLATSIFGGAFLIPMMLGGLGSDLDGDFGGDLELDSDIEFDGDGGGDLPTAVSNAGLDGGGFETGLLGAMVASLVSFRTVVFFSAFFGAAGLVFGALGYGSATTLGTALLIGTMAAVVNSMLFGLIKSSQPNSQISDRTLEGQAATVVLPMSEHQRGRIRIELNDQPQYIVAKPVERAPGTPEQTFDVGASVVVVKIEQGTAHVAALHDLGLGEVQEY